MRTIKPSTCFRVAAVLSLFALPLSAHALTPSEVFEQVKDSVFVVKSFDAKGEQTALGSGVLLPSGKIATNCHVVKEGVSFQVGRGKQFVPATVFAGDEDKDICLLDAKSIGGKPARLGKAADLKIGEPVYAVGAPQGLELSLSDGIVSQLRGGPPPFIQTTAAISPGSSGGGLFDQNGRLVGFTTLYLDGGQSLNFAMPVEWLAAIKSGQKKAAKGRTETDWIMQASALEKRRDWDDLRDWCRQWVKADPKNAIAWVALGEAYSQLDRHTEAIDAYRQSIRINPEHADTWYNLGTTYSGLGRHTDAIDALRQSIRIDPEYAEAWYNLGITYGGLDRHTDAIDAYRQAIRINPEHANAWNNLGIAFDKLNRYTDAIGAYRQAIRINPEDADTWYNLGNAYGKLNRNTDAIDSSRQAIRINPEHPYAWGNLGIAYIGLKRYPDAIDAYRRAIRINPEYANAWYGLGLAYELSGNRTAALETVNTLRPLDPDRAERLFNLLVPR